MVAFHLGSFLNNDMASRVLFGGNGGLDDDLTTTLEMQNLKKETPLLRNGYQRPDDPVYWISDVEDNYFERTYIDITPLTHLRLNIPVKHYFPKVCGLYRFDESKLPTVSVIITLRNEVEDMVRTTVHSILARTPSSLLMEVIIVDDSEEKPNPELDELTRVSDKVVIIPTTQREGCARSRLIGARKARGTVLMFVDSHIEMLSSTWYQHLVLPIVENPHTITSQQLQYMGDLSNHTYDDPAGRGSHFGTTNDKFFFGYQSVRFKDTAYEEKPSISEPFEMPFAPGALFAIRADEFWRLGGYDEGLYVWGGENMELSLKIWLCGGRLVQVPCSNTGHMYRTRDIHKWTNDIFDDQLINKLRINETGVYKAYGVPNMNTMSKIWLRNNIRVASIWLGDAKRYYYENVFGSKILPPEWAKFEEEDEDLLKQIQFKEKNQCRDFKWFDKHVFMRLLGNHNPWHEEMKKDEAKLAAQEKNQTNQNLTMG